VFTENGEKTADCEKRLPERNKRGRRIDVINFIERKFKFML